MTAASGLTLDTGALIAIDRGDQDMRALLRRARAHGWPIVIPTGALAQAWRGGTRQARLAGFLGTRREGPALHPLDGTVARAAGELCGRVASNRAFWMQTALIDPRITAVCIQNAVK